MRMVLGLDPIHASHFSPLQLLLNNGLSAKWQNLHNSHAGSLRVDILFDIRLKRWDQIKLIYVMGCVVSEDGGDIFSKHW